MLCRKHLEGKSQRETIAWAAAHFHCSVWGSAQPLALTKAHQTLWKAFPVSALPSQTWQTTGINTDLKSLITYLLVQLIHHIWLVCKLFSAASADLNHHPYCCQAGENPLIQICVGTFAGSTYRHLSVFCQFCRHGAALIPSVSENQDQNTSLKANRYFAISNQTHEGRRALWYSAEERGLRLKSPCSPQGLSHNPLHRAPLLKEQQHLGNTGQPDSLLYLIREPVRLQYNFFRALHLPKFE